MYIPQHFSESRIEVIHGFLRANPFCSLVCVGAEGLVATHLPMVLDTTQGEKGVLRGHVARANPHRHCGDAEALAIFHGVDGYVSPSFYPSKRVHGRVVPTWNYSVVHVSGRARFVDDVTFVESVVGELTTLMESTREHPWKMGDAPRDFLEKSFRAIVGVELQIGNLQAKFKLSQNRAEPDVQGVVEGLSNSVKIGDREVADLMKGVFAGK